METIVDNQRKLLMQFDVLLQHNKLGITRTRLLKILALNIFVMEHNLNKGYILCIPNCHADANQYLFHSI